MRRLVRKLKLRWLAGLVGGFAFACSGPTNPGEMPPLAPRPEPMQPVPAETKPAPTTTPPVVPGSPDPIPGDAGVTEVPAPEVRSYASPEPQQKPPVDAANVDALLPPAIPDALPPDARKQPESTAFACC